MTGPGRELVASPLGFEGTYVDHYLRALHGVRPRAGAEVEHPHRAIDDARGDAHLLVEVLRRSRRV